VFGSYVFSLTVTDAIAQTATCSVKHGFVLTDANGIVNTGSTTLDTLLGKLIRSGLNPWPWADDRHTAAADFNIVYLADGSYYQEFWEDSQGPGTVTVTEGSAAVTGVGTDFTTRYCEGPGSPTVVKTAAGGQHVLLLLWYPDSSPEGYGLRFQSIASCTDDTHLTLDAVWFGNGHDCAAGGCSYSYDDPSNSYGGVWNWPERAGSNYYDAVAAFYALYYRSGIDDYLTAARDLADRDWKYRMDSGFMCYYGPGDRCGGSLQPRSYSALGFVLRANDGRSDMWPGLENLWSYSMSLATDSISWGIWDTREEAYMTAMIAYCALYDTDATYRANCKTSLSGLMEDLWGVNQSATGTFDAFYGAHSSWLDSCHVDLTNSSTTVTADGCTFDSAHFPTHIVFQAGLTAPANNAATENVYYTATYSNDTTLTLDAPYAGTTGEHGWMIGYGTCPGECFVGWGSQPFMVGILGFAFDMTAKALTVSDPTNAALALHYNADLATWQKDYGYRPAVKGMQYMVGTVDCPTPINESWTWCTASMTPTQARTLNAESLRSVMLAYQQSSNATLKTFADTLYNSMWAAPGTCPVGSTACVADGDYISDWDDGAWFLQPPPGGSPWNNRWHKYFGMSFGIGGSASWPAVRLGPYTAPTRFIRGRLTTNVGGTP
jgi:hypothetical protein